MPPTTIDRMTDLMTEADVADLTKVARATLANYRHTGRGPAFFKFSAKRIMYDRADVIAWMQAHRHTSTASLPPAERRPTAGAKPKAATRKASPSPNGKARRRAGR